MLQQILTFLGGYPVLGFFLFCVIATTFYYTIYGVLVVLPSRFFRHLTISKHGYPPPHCDADGDFRPEEEDDDEEEEDDDEEDEDPKDE